MADKFDWADEYKKRGFEVFDQESVKSLRAIQRKYRSDYRKFFMEVANVEKGQGRPQQLKRVDEVLAKIDKIWHLIDSILSTTSTTLSGEELKEMFLLTNEVDDDFRFFSDPENLSVPMQKRIKEAEKKTSIRATDLAQANRAIKGRLLEAGRGKTFGEKFGHLAPALKPLGDASKEVRDYLLGPFESVYKAGASTVGGIGNMIKAHKERKKELSRRAFTQSTLLSEEATPEFLNAYSGAGSFGVGPVPKVMGGGYRKSTPKFAAKEPEAARSPFSTRATRERGRQTQQDLGQALFSFFNKDAFRAKWTRELYEALTGKKGLGGAMKAGEEGGDFGILDFLGLKEGLRMVKKGFSKLVPVLVALGSAAAIAASAFAGWKLGEWIEKNVKIGGRNPGEYMPVVQATKVGFGIRNLLSKRQMIKGLRPESIRALELQKQGMSVLESHQQAHAEFSQPLSWDSKGKLSREPLPENWRETQGVSASIVSQPTQEVPIVASSGGAEGFVSLGQTFEKQMDKMLDGVERMNRARAFEGSGVDARDIDDPLLSSGLNSGMLGI